MEFNPITGCGQMQVDLPAHLLIKCPYFFTNSSSEWLWAVPGPVDFYHQRLLIKDQRYLTICSPCDQVTSSWSTGRSSASSPGTGSELWRPASEDASVNLVICCDSPGNQAQMIRVVAIAPIIVSAGSYNKQCPHVPRVLMNADSLRGLLAVYEFCSTMIRVDWLGSYGFDRD